MFETVLEETKYIKVKVSDSSMKRILEAYKSKLLKGYDEIIVKEDTFRLFKHGTGIRPYIKDEYGPAVGRDLMYQIQALDVLIESIKLK